MDVSNHRLLQNIFLSYRNVLAQRRLPSSQRKAIDSIVDCRSGRLGTSFYACDNGHAVHEQHHACRHRSCYLCARNGKRIWIEEQKSRLLNCPHFHMVFTLPSEYRVLWQYNKRWFTQALFRAVQETVLSLMQDERHQGVTPGLVLALHTWGRQLNLHPHIHAVVTAGGLDNKCQWKDSGRYLLPIHVLKVLYRGKLQSLLKQAYESGEIVLPPSMTKADFYATHARVYRKAWSVRVEEQYSHGKGVMVYLSKYLKGGPIHPTQIGRCDDRGISFVYKDHRDQRQKVLTLTPMEFIGRLLAHVPEPGLHTVRHYGLYGAAAREKRNACREKMGDGVGIEPGNRGGTSRMAELLCKKCNQIMGIRFRRYPDRGEKGNSYKQAPVPRIVQPGDETDHVKPDKHEQWRTEYG